MKNLEEGEWTQEVNQTDAIETEKMDKKRNWENAYIAITCSEITFDFFVKLKFCYIFIYNKAFRT